MGIVNFFKNAFRDMKQSAKEQHEVNKAELRAVKAESRASFEEAKAMGRPETRKKLQQQEREARIHAANDCIADANRRYDEAKKG